MAVVAVVAVVVVVVVVVATVAGIVIKRSTWWCGNCARSGRVSHGDIELANDDIKVVSVDIEDFLELVNISAEPDSNFNEFITSRVIPKFEKIRVLGFYQFAVLILVPLNEELQDVKFTPPLPNAPSDNQLWPVNIPQFPQNYIAACPKHGVHSEVRILEHFKQLWNRIKHTPPSQIILYSWIMPCEDCTQKIIQTFRQSPFNSTSVIIAYTIEYYKETDRQAIVNRKQLETHGFYVRHVKSGLHSS